MTPTVRLRLSRIAGFNLQAHSRAVNGLPAAHVARPGRWGNPFRVTATCDAAMAIWMHATYLTNLQPDLSPLRGHNLACWCALDAPCHADNLLLLACDAPRV